MSAANLKQLLLAHPTFANRKIDVIKIPKSDTTSTNGPLSGLDVADGNHHINVQRVTGVGDFIIIYPK